MFDNNFFIGLGGKDELDRVQAVRANSKLTQTTVLDTQPTVYLNSFLLGGHQNDGQSQRAQGSCWVFQVVDSKLRSNLTFKAIETI